MKFVFVVPTYFPAERYGGTITAIKDLAEEFSVSENVAVYTTLVDGKEDLPYPPGEPIIINGVSVAYFRVKMFRRFYFCPSMLSGLIRNLKQEDIVVIHAVFSFPQLAAYIACRLKGTSYVVMPHGMLVKSLIEAKGRTRKKTWLRLFGRGIYERASAVRVTSEREKADLLDFNWILRKIINLPNPTNIPAKKQNYVVSNDLAGLIENRNLIIFVGRINWKKRIEILISAMEYVPEGHLAIIGPDPECHSRKLRGLIDQKQLRNRISIIDRHIKGDDLEAIYRGAYLFALTSLNENFGNTVIEAMGRGLPVVVTAGIGAADFVRAGNGGLVVYNDDPQSIGEALQSLVVDRSRREELSRSGEEYVKRELNRKVICNALMREFKESVTAK